MQKKVLPVPMNEDQSCPRCGLMRRELYAQGQMGCPDCYQIFHLEVERALKEIHGSVKHIGKA